jgi:hypothetical protein
MLSFTARAPSPPATGRCSIEWSGPARQVQSGRGSRHRERPGCRRRGDRLQRRPPPRGAAFGLHVMTVPPPETIHTYLPSSRAGAPAGPELAAPLRRLVDGHDGAASSSHLYTRRCVREPQHLSFEMSSNVVRIRTEALDSRSKNHSTRPPDRVPFRQSGVLHHPGSGRDHCRTRFPRGLTDICMPHVVTWPPMNPRLRDFPRHAM